MRSLTLACVTALLSAVSTSPCLAQSPGDRTLSQTLYLPIYSHLWHGDLDGRGQPQKTLVSVLVSIRNTDPGKTIRVTSAQYFDTAGKRIKEYVPSPVSIGPMGTYEIFVPRADDTGGSGANFVIAWRADSRASTPVVHGVHANLPTGRPIIFLTEARAIVPE